MDTYGEENKTASADHDGSKKKETEVTTGDYLRAVKTALRTGKQKEAYVVLQQAAVHFPDDPIILSYLGCFQSVLDRKYRTGVDNCKKALAMLRKGEFHDKQELIPLLHLNLGRAFLAAGKKKDAIETFSLGLKYDSSNSDLIKELKGMGARKKPLVPFLDRSNPINKYIGLLLHANSPKPAARKKSVSRS